MPINDEHATPIPGGTAEIDGPDWFGFTDEDLQGHAHTMVDDLYQRLQENDAHPERPHTAISYSRVDIPCPDLYHCTLQLRYIGFMTERFIQYGINVRELVAVPFGQQGCPVLRLVVFTDAGYAQAQAEHEDAERH